MMSIGVVSVAALALSGLYAVWSDLRSRRLSNGLCLIVAVAGLLFEVASGGMAAAVSAATHGAIALTIGAALFTAGGWGGGDAKYYAAVACWFGLDRAIALLAAVSGVGLVLAGGWLLALRFRVISAVDNAGDRRAEVPFGVAIAVGAVLAAGRAA